LRRLVEVVLNHHVLVREVRSMADQPCIIGKNITIRGNVSGGEDLVVEGRIEGTVTISNRLTVEEAGVVEADLDVEDLTVNGTVQGEIRASRSVALSASAKVIGNLRAPRVVIEDGARFKGRVEMDVTLPAGLEAESARE
jgi:cytoskeletal protein CcmA (bactofilin family)